jgi:hypothetical protein
LAIGQINISFSCANRTVSASTLPMMMASSPNAITVTSISSSVNDIPELAAPPGAGTGNDQRLLYVIRNGKLGPEWQASEGTTLAIAGRSLNTLIKAQARGDVERLQVMAERNRMGFRLAAIPDSFRQVAQEAFDRDYMRNLFELGYRQAHAAYPWAAALP